LRSMLGNSTGTCRRAAPLGDLRSARCATPPAGSGPREGTCTSQGDVAHSHRARQSLLNRTGALFYDHTASFPKERKSSPLRSAHESTDPVYSPSHAATITARRRMARPRSGGRIPFSPVAYLYRPPDPGGVMDVDAITVPRIDTLVSRSVRDRTSARSCPAGRLTEVLWRSRGTQTICSARRPPRDEPADRYARRLARYTA